MAFTSGQILTAAQLNTFDPGTKITNAGGTAGSPSYTFNGDTNTGMFRTGADSVSLATGGTARLTIDSAGNVGIGTTSPETPLNIVTPNTLGSTFTGTVDGEGLRVDQSDYSSGNYVSLVEASYDDGQTEPHVRIGAMFDGSGSHLAFGTSNSFGSGITNTALFIDETGQVGIGTTSPSQLLDIEHATTAIMTINDSGGTVGSNTNSRIQFQAGGSTAGEIGFLNTGGGIMGVQNQDGPIYLTTDTADDILIRPNQSTAMTIKSGGAVGIGTSSPAGNFQVESQGRAFTIIDSGVSNHAEAAFTTLGGDSPALSIISGYDLDFFTGTSRGGLTSRFHIDQSGNSKFTGEVRLTNGNAGDPAINFQSDTNTGIFRKAADQLGFACGGSVVGYFDTSSGGRFFGPGASTGTAIIRSTTSAATPTYAFFSDEDTGIYRHTTNQLGITAGGTTSLIAAGGTVNTAGLSTSTLTGYKYVVRNTTFGTLYHYTSSRDFKENITDVTASNAGTWIDALQPVTFNERWLQEGDESDENKAWREADVQVGFIADDVLANSTTAQFAQVEDVDGTLKGVGWKWECVIAAAVAEIKSLRTRVATLEA